MAQVVWKEAPIVYVRNENRGYGMVVGAMHYMYTPGGLLSHAEPLQDHILLLILSKTHPNPGLAMVAGTLEIPEPEQDAGEGDAG